MLGKVYEKMSYEKSGDKFQPRFEKEFVINLNKVKKIVTKKSAIEPASYVTEIYFTDGSTEKCFRCNPTTDISLEQHRNFINSWFLPRPENV
jgi:hypothetical protein